MNFTSPFNYYNREFDYRIATTYLSGTITLPANKYIKGKQYKDYQQIEQVLILRNLLKDLKLDSIYESFEAHPNRNGGNMHMHFLFENKKGIPCDVLVEFAYHNLFTKTKSTIIHKICKFEKLEREYNVINWLNYMFKDYKEHWFLLPSIMENTLQDSIKVMTNFIY